MTQKKSALEEALSSVRGFLGNVGSVVQKTVNPFLDTSQKSTQNFFKNVQNDFNNWSKQQDVQIQQNRQNAGNFFNNVGQTASKVAPNLLKFVLTPPQQQIWESPATKKVSQDFPRTDFAEKITNPVGSFLVGIPEGFLNIPSDILRSQVQLADTQKKVRQGEYVPPQKFIGDVAGAALPIASILPVGKGVQIIEQTGKIALKSLAKQGAITGLKFGAGLGFLGGLKEGSEAPNIVNQFGQALISAAIGAPTGAVLGAVLEPFLSIVGKKAIQPAIKEWNKMTPSQKQAGFIRFVLDFPEAIPPEIKQQLAKNQGSYSRDFLNRVEKGNISAGDLQRVGIKITRTDLKTLIQNSPELKANPVLIYSNDFLHFNGQKHRFSIAPSTLGIDATRLAEGDVVNIASAITEKGKISVLVRKGGTPSATQPKTEIANAGIPNIGANAQPLTQVEQLVYAKGVLAKNPELLRNKDYQGLTGSNMHGVPDKIWQEASRSFAIPTKTGVANTGIPIKEEVKPNGVEVGLSDTRKLPPYSLKRSGIDTVWHETSPESARNIVFAGMDKSGLNVATSPDLALGQKGKGVKIEIDASQLSGRKIIKPASKFVTQTSGKHPEYQLFDSPSQLTPHIKSVTFDEPLTRKGERAFFGLRDNWKATKEILPDGKVKYTNPDYMSPVSQPTIGEVGGIKIGQPVEPTVPLQAKSQVGLKVAPEQTPVGLKIPQIEGENIPSGGKIPSSPKTESKIDPESFADYTYNWLDKVYTESLDRFHPLSKLAKTANQVQAMRDALTGSYGSGSIGMYHIEFLLKPIFQTIKKAGVSQDDFRQAGIAMRDIELGGKNIQGSNLGGLNFDELSGFKGNEQTMAAIKRLGDLRTRLGEEKMNIIGRELQNLYAYQDNLVKEYLVKTEVMSETAYRSMKSKNQFYVPFKRVMDFVDEQYGIPQKRGVGSVGSQNVIKGIKGSKRDIVDPFESIIENTWKIVGLGQRQKVAKTIVGLKNTLPKGMITRWRGTVGNRPIISVFENGKVQHYLVPPEVAIAAKGLNEEQLSATWALARLGTEFFRATATAINPEFMLPNTLRDLQSAFVNFGVNPLNFAKGFAHLIHGDQMYQDFLKSGAMTYRLSLDRPHLTRTVEKLSGKGFKMTNARDLYHLMENFGAYSEQPTRIAAFEQEYTKALKQGLGREDAMARGAYAAQEATVNFARRGARMQEINSLWAFLNARMQGIDRSLRTIKNDPIKGTFRTGMTVIPPVLILYAWNQRFPTYFDQAVVSDKDKQNNWIIMLSNEPIGALGGAQYAKIPKFEIGKLANPIENFLAYADGHGDIDIKNQIASILKVFSPFDNMGDIAPTVARPPLEIAFNYDPFYKQQIIPSSKKNYPAQYQYSYSTSPLYRSIANKLAGIGLQVSPAQMQTIAGGYGTGYARIAEMGAQLGVKYKGLGGQYDVQGEDINRVPLARRVLGGRKRSEEEQQTSLENKVNSYNYKISEIKTGINKGELPLDVGLQTMDNLRQDQQKALTQVTGGKALDLEKKELRWLENDKLSIIDLTPYSKSATGLEKFKLDDEKYKDARDIYESTGLSNEEKLDAYKYLKLDPVAVEYDYTANLTGEVKTNYLYDSLKDKPYDEIMTNLMSGRVESISGSIFTNNGTIDNLYEKGLISYEDAKYLKSVKFNAKGKNIGTSSRPKAPKKISMPKLTAPKPVKLQIKTQSTIKPLKIASIKMPKVSIKQNRVSAKMPTLKVPQVGLKIKRAITNIQSLGRV